MISSSASGLWPGSFTSPVRPTQQILKLERRLGLALFERDKLRVRIMPAGSSLLAHADRILSDLVAVEEEMQTLERPELVAEALDTFLPAGARG
jgi:DNA-binding transcriptional LysR family regulator